MCQNSEPSEGAGVEEERSRLTESGAQRRGCTSHLWIVGQDSKCCITTTTRVRTTTAAPSKTCKEVLFILWCHLETRWRIHCPKQ